MQLELPVRWTETDKERSRTEELLRGELAEEKVKHTFGRLLINSDDIGPYYSLDENHTMINDRLGKLYCITIPIDEFKKILTEVTGKAIMAIHVREQPTRPTPTKKKPRNSDDDILL